MLAQYLYDKMQVFEKNLITDPTVIAFGNNECDLPLKI